MSKRLEQLKQEAVERLVEGISYYEEDGFYEVCAVCNGVAEKHEKDCITRRLREELKDKETK